MTLQPAILLNVFLVAVIFIHLFRPKAVELGFIDVPFGRKRHENATPTCGGLGIVLAIAVAALFGSLSAAAAVCLWVLVTACIGALDDLWDLSARIRLLGCGGATLLLFATGEIAPVNLGDLTGGVMQIMPIVGLTIAFGFAMLLINSINMMDGLDGLAGGVSLAALFWTCAIAAVFGDYGIAGDAQIVMAATAGFLVFNLRGPWRARAAVFLGDAGSTALGAALSYLIIALAGIEGGPTLPALLWLVAVPLIDTFSLIVRRMKARRSPFTADRWHLHHLLLDLGVSQQRASLVIAATAFVCGGVGYVGILLGVSASVMVAGLVLPVAAHTALVLRASKIATVSAPAAPDLSAELATFIAPASAPPTPPSQ